MVIKVSNQSLYKKKSLKKNRALSLMVINKVFSSSKTNNSNTVVPDIN